jgi:hypothetical protein
VKTRHKQTRHYKALQNPEQKISYKIKKNVYNLELALHRQRLNDENDQAELASCSTIERKISKI